MTPGFKRLWSAPHRTMRGGLLDPLTPQQRYLQEQSRARYRRRPDAYPAGQEQLKGELGYVDGFRFITSPVLPDPDQLAARITQRMNASAIAHLTTNRESLAARISAQIERSGTAFIKMGVDLANGPDWTVVQDWRRPDPVPPALLLHDQERLAAAELKRARRRIKLRELAAKGAIPRLE